MNALNGTGILSDLGKTQTDNNHATVSGNTVFNLRKNSKIKLSTGEGFINPGYYLVGWSNKPDWTESDAVRYELGGTYGVSEVQNTIYAIWYPVIFDLSFTKKGENIDGTESGLNNAAFTLTNEDGSKTFGTAYSGNVNGTDGIVSFINIIPNGVSSLKLSETASPNGYEKSKEVYTDNM